MKALALQALRDRNEAVQLESSRNKEATINFALCYAVSGAFLCHRDIVRTGMRLAIELIDWDIVELALHFRLCVADFVVGYDFSSSKPAAVTATRQRATIFHPMFDLKVTMIA